MGKKNRVSADKKKCQPKKKMKKNNTSSLLQPYSPPVKQTTTMNIPSTPDSKTNKLREVQMNIPSSPPTNALDQILQRQRERAETMMKPLSSSSPIKSDSDASLPFRAGSRGRYNHHVIDSPRSQNFNLRNKHNKLRQVRNQHRHDKLMLQREAIDSRQFREDVLNKYETEYKEVTNNMNIDQLIEDEQEIVEGDEFLDYLDEAEQREWEEDAELIDMILSLEISQS